MEYKIVKIESTAEKTEDMLNLLSLRGWKVVCSYAYDNSHLILSKE